MDKKFICEDIIVWKGIITKYSIAMLWADDAEIREANKDEVNIYMNRPDK